MKMTKEKKAFDAAPWTGPTRKYDIVKEGVIALVVCDIRTALQQRRRRRGRRTRQHGAIDGCAHPG